MKKLIIIFLSIFIAIPNGYAADSDLSCTAYIDGSCPPGCYPFAQQPTGICFKCEPGTYSSQDHNDVYECLLCSKPSEATFTDGEGAYGNTSNDCPWQLTCGAGQYWNDDEAQCTNCGEYYQDDNGSCTVIGRGDDNTQLNSPSCDFDNRCIGKVYKLYLTKNRGLNSENTITLDYKYNTGFAKEGSQEWSLTLPDRHRDTLFKKLTGYHTNKDCSNGSLVFSFNKDGELALTSTGWSSLGGDKTLYACWEKLQQTIIYRDKDGNQIGQSQSCTAEEDEEFVCPARDCTLADDGVVFSKYECTYLDENGSEQYCDPRFLGIGDTIPPLGKATIYLTIQTDPCPAGYYCEAGTPTSCPGGSTSDDGAANINKCYMDKGTQFCDSVGCFNLPDGIKIYYQGGDEANN